MFTEPAALHSFGCPHCGGVTPVAEAQLGQVVPCAACARPFRADMPAGKLLSAPPPPPSQAHSGIETKLQPAKPESVPVWRLHPAPWRMRFLATCFDAVLIVGGMGVAGAAYRVWENRQWAYFFLAGGAALGLVGVVNLLVPWLRSRSETLELTEASTRWSKGFFRRRSVEIRHNAVRAVEVEQAFSERLLGIGTLTLASDGNDADEIVMKGVPGVKAVAAQIRELQGRQKGR